MLICKPETLNEIATKYPGMTIKEFINMKELEEIEYEEYLAELDRDYRSNNMNYV